MSSKKELSPLPGGLFGGGSYCPDCLKALGVTETRRDSVTPKPPPAPALRAAGDARTGEDLVRAVAIGLVGLTLTKTILWPRSPGVTPSPPVVDFLLIGASGAIAYFLWLGRSWARWLTVGVGALALYRALAGLVNAGDVLGDVGLMRRLYVASIVFYGSAVPILAFSPSVRAFFQARRSTPNEERKAVRAWDRVFGIPTPPQGLGTFPDETVDPEDPPTDR